MARCKRCKGTNRVETGSIRLSQFASRSIMGPCPACAMKANPPKVVFIDGEDQNTTTDVSAIPNRTDIPRCVLYDLRSTT
jgi:hypothetical protein